MLPGHVLTRLLDTVVPAAVAEHVVATAREARSNAARHAGASQVEVMVTFHDASLQLLCPGRRSRCAGTCGTTGRSRRRGG